jgi:hypothetical protein
MILICCIGHDAGTLTRYSALVIPMWFGASSQALVLRIVVLFVN